MLAKTYPGPDGPRLVAAEAAGLRWLAEAGAPVPELVEADGARLVLGWIEATPQRADEALGRALAALHRFGAPAIGHDPTATGSTFLGRVELPCRPAESWHEFWATCRLEPLLARLSGGAGVSAGTRGAGGVPAGTRGAGGVSAETLAPLARLADRSDLWGPDEPPARLHGDLWWGNVLVGTPAAEPGPDRSDEGGPRSGGPGSTPWLIDPAAHGGHREVDLALLDLFGGLPDDLVRGYDETYPLADGWTDRLALHQITPLLVHAVMFGGGYLGRALATAGRYA